MAKRILVIEDDKDISENLGELLRSEGYSVALAENGKHGLEILRNDVELPSLILLDLMMPVMDGVQFREQQVLDQRIASIPVVIMSADGNVADRAARVGVVKYLKKPLDLMNLLETIENASTP